MKASSSRKRIPLRDQGPPRSNPGDLGLDDDPLAFDSSALPTSRSEWFHADGDFDDPEEGADDAPPPVDSRGTETLGDMLDTDMNDEAFEIEEEMRIIEEEFLRIYESDMAEAKLNSMGERIFELR
jgi:hypothetical protein